MALPIRTKAGPWPSRRRHPAASRRRRAPRRPRARSRTRRRAVPAAREGVASSGVSSDLAFGGEVACAEPRHRDGGRKALRASGLSVGWPKPCPGPTVPRCRTQSMDAGGRERVVEPYPSRGGRWLLDNPAALTTQGKATRHRTPAGAGLSGRPGPLSGAGFPGRRLTIASAPHGSQRPLPPTRPMKRSLQQFGHLVAVGPELRQRLA